MKDEALKLALEAHQAMREWIDAVPDDTVLPAMPGCDRDWIDTVEATLKQAIAAPTVQPVGVATGCASHEGFFTVVFRSSQPIPDGTGLYTNPPAAAVQEGRDWSLLEATQESLREHIAEIKRLKAAQRQWVGLSQDELDAMFSNTIKGKKLVNWVARAIEAKLKEKNAAAQPAVPDALTSADIQEHIEYVAGWNDCRAEMLKGMK
jgi:hypothetical protein